MTKNEQVLNFLKTRAEECDEKRRHRLQQMVNNIPAEKDALSMETSTGNFNLVCSLQSDVEELTKAVAQLTVYSAMYRVFDQKYKNSANGIKDMAEWLQVVVLERASEVSMKEMALYNLHAYSRVLRYLAALVDDDSTES